MNCVMMKKKLNGEVFCKELNKNISPFNCNNCTLKSYSKSSQKHKQTKATDIPKKVKLIVWERDNHKCIFCSKPVPWNCANSHYIKRSHGGLGIEENIMTNCEKCHAMFEESPYRSKMKASAKRYFESMYPNWDEKELIYKKSQKNH